MDDRIRVSDADRDHVTARLRDHFAQGRLTADELDERLSAALNAKTVGDLRHVMVDLPEPAPVAPRAAHRAQRAGPPPWVARRHHRPRLLPVLLLVLFAMLVIPSGGWVLFAFLRVALLVWLVTCLARIIVGLFHRRMHRYW
jgi:Domain of unknown function (DUF1707)